MFKYTTTALQGFLLSSRHMTVIHGYRVVYATHDWSDVTDCMYHNALQLLVSFCHSRQGGDEHHTIVSETYLYKPIDKKSYKGNNKSLT